MSPDDLGSDRLSKGSVPERNGIIVNWDRRKSQLTIIRLIRRCAGLLGFEAQSKIGNVTKVCDLGHFPFFGFAPNFRVPKEANTMETRSTQCRFCGAVNQRKFLAEMMVRPPGLKNIDTRPVLLFPPIFVCLECCMAEFEVPQAELRQLVQSDATATNGDLELSICRGRSCG